MRKLFVCLLLLLFMLLCAPALAETYVFDDIYGTMEVPDTYVVLTEANLDQYEEWLKSNRGATVQETLADFEARGVLLQAWGENLETCFELRATQTAETLLIFDVNEQTESLRGTYRTSHYPYNEYPGYDFSSSQWTRNDNGRFLALKYVMRDGGEILYRGFMRRTIRNGYEIDFDMRVYGRNATTSDNTNLNKIWETFKFVEILDMPPAASAQINITDTPPEETNEASFNIKGTAAEGVTFTAVAMGLTHPDPVVTTVTVGSNGKFTLPVELPREGVFLITLTGEFQGEDVVELAYPVTYQSTLLAVNFTTKPGDVTLTDEVTFAGTAEPSATIQVFVDGDSVLSKRVTSAGKFTIEVDLEEEGSHEVALVFSKKGLADRRLQFTVTRQWTEDDMVAYLDKQSISPNYSQLVSRMEEYEGRIMNFRAYLVNIAMSGDQYVVRMALNRSGDEYQNIILVMASEEPAFAVDERVMMYGTCAGMSLSTGAGGEEDDESYPCFELILFASLE